MSQPRPDTPTSRASTPIGPAQARPGATSDSTQAQQTTSSATTSSGASAQGSSLPIATVKHLWRLEGVVPALGVPLIRAGDDRLVGHCPFHEDHTPSFTVYCSTQRFRCYGRCGRHGDILDLVQALRGCSLAEAIHWLEPTWQRGIQTEEMRRTRESSEAIEPGTQATRVTQTMAAQGADADNPRGKTGASEFDGARAEADRQLVLTLATVLYAHALPQHPAVMTYLQQRGISPKVAERCRLGYVAGGALAAAFAHEPTLRAAAMHCGLLSRWGRECLAGRVVVPEVRDGRTVWLIGRCVPPTSDQIPTDSPAAAPARRKPPRYLGLATPRHYLLGYGTACAALVQRPALISADGTRELVAGLLVVEGALDYVVAQGWRLPVPCVALLGTHASPGQLAELADLQRRSGGASLLLALDSDEAGRVATKGVAHALAARGLTYQMLPPLPDAKDLGELGMRGDGRAALLKVLEQALGARVRSTALRWTSRQTTAIAQAFSPASSEPLPDDTGDCGTEGTPSL